MIQRWVIHMETRVYQEELNHVYINENVENIICEYYIPDGRGKRP